MCRAIQAGGTAEAEERGTYPNSRRLGENFHEGGARLETWTLPSVVRR